MCRTAPRLIALAALLLALFAAPVLAKELYRWVDEKGVVHYSDKRPEGQAFERRQMANDPATASTEAANPDDPEATEATEAAAKAEPPKPKGPPSADCLQARSNLAVLNSATEVSMDINGDGVPETLDAAGRQREIARHQELVKSLCDE